MAELVTNESAESLLAQLAREVDPTRGRALSARLLSEHADRILRGVIRAKLRVSLDPDDKRGLNQDAQDVLGEVRMQLCARLDPAGTGGREPITTFNSYVATAARHACDQYL